MLSSTFIMHTKVLIRTDSFIEHYQQWLKKEVNEVIEILSGSYANEVFGMGADDLKFEKLPDLSRITWNPTVLKTQELGFLMDFFKSKLEECGYCLNLSDERQEIFDSGLRLIIHRHFLKPTIGDQELLNMRQNAKFGKLYLEHRFNGKVNSFCLTASYYDHLNQSSFEKLMEFLLV